MPTRNRAHLDTRLEAFCNDLSLDLIRPVAPTRRTFQDLKSADVAPSRNQQMLHRLFQRFAPNQNAKLAQTTLTENPLKPWGARTAYAKLGFQLVEGRIRQPVLAEIACDF